MSEKLKIPLTCPSCDYNLRGLSIPDLCPECGSDPYIREKSSTAKTWLIWGCVGLGCGAVIDLLSYTASLI
jgi:predicted RNA-binding Zn-ribbon protein involved in translation (DUF1610 family)